MQTHIAGFGEVVEASATSMSVCKELPPPDTLLGSLKFTSGKPASVSISFAGSVLRFSLSVTGTKGSLEVGLALSNCSCCVCVGLLTQQQHTAQLFAPSLLAWRLVCHLSSNAPDY